MVLTFFLILPFAWFVLCGPQTNGFAFSVWYRRLDVVHLTALHVYRWLFWSFDVVVYPFLWTRPWSSQYFPTLYCPSSRTSYPFVPFRDILDDDSAQYEFFAVAVAVERSLFRKYIFYLTLSTWAFRALIILCNFDFILLPHSILAVLLSIYFPSFFFLSFFPSLKTSFFGAAPFSWECQKNILKMYIIHIFAKFRMHIVAWNFLTFSKAPTNTHRSFDDLKL